MKPKALLVEDTAEFALLGGTLLEREGYAVLSAASGADASVSAATWADWVSVRLAMTSQAMERRKRMYVFMSIPSVRLGDGINRRRSGRSGCCAGAPIP